MEVVEEPDRLEAEPLGLERHLRRPPPRVEGVPAVVLALPALRDDGADPHRELPALAMRTGGRIALGSIS